MKKLLIIPQGGLCNRLRTIAAAKRIAKLLGYELTVFWNWGDYKDLFESDGIIAINKYQKKFETYHFITTKYSFENGMIQNQKLDINSFEKVIVCSCHIFNDNCLPRIELKDLLQYFPRPNKRIKEKLAWLRESFFSNNRIVGVHIRRTDNKESIVNSPDELFINKMNNILLQDDIIFFLCSDNEQTLNRFKSIFKEKIVGFPKSKQPTIRWPREKFDILLTIDDYLEVLLLSSCEYILGSYFSSFSSIAMALNGSLKNEILTANPN